MDDRRFGRARTLQSVFEGQRAESILGEAGIPCQVVSYRDTALDGLFQFTRGWGEVRVPEAEVGRAEQLLAEQLPPGAAVPEDELADEALKEPEPVSAAPGRASPLVIGALVLAALAGAALLLFRFL
jgi:hypothetical protein